MALEYPIPVDPGVLASDGIITINPVGLVFFVVDILEWLGVIPDPIDLLFSLFSGRPRELDTVNVASWLMHAHNPSARIWGSLLSRGLTELDIVLSASDPFGVQFNDDIRHNFVLSMVAQGYTLQQAKNHANYALQATDNPSQPYTPPFKAGLVAGQVLNGPGEWSNTFMARYQQSISAGDDSDTAYRKAFKYTLKHLALKYLRQVVEGDPVPIQVTPPPPGGQNPPPGGLPPPPLPPPGGSQGGDELTDCCQQSAYYLWAIANAISLMSGGGGVPQAPDTTCCDQIVAAIDAVANNLANAANNITVDTTPIADAIAGLKDAIAAIPAPVVNVTVQPDDTPDPNVKRIADELAPDPAAAAQLRAVVQRMNEDGTIDPGIAQILLT